MPPKRKIDKKSPTSRASAGGGSAAASTGSSKSSGGGKSDKDLPPPAGYLVSCDIPTKQFIKNYNDNEIKNPDHKFILEDLDAEHLLVKKKARADIETKVERWMDEVSVTELDVRECLVLLYRIDALTVILFAWHDSLECFFCN